MKAGMMYDVLGEAFCPVAPDPGVLLSEGGPGAVSYTHLTLPTKA